jgi:hypothetical protein
MRQLALEHAKCYASHRCSLTEGLLKQTPPNVNDLDEGTVATIQTVRGSHQVLSGRSVQDTSSPQVTTPRASKIRSALVP